MVDIRDRRHAIARAAANVSRWLQVKQHGQYSIDRVRKLGAYSRHTSLCRVIAVVVLSPLPSLALCAVVDALALEPPHLGLAQNHTFVARYFVVSWLLSCITIHDVRYRVSSLPFSHRRLLVSSTLLSAASTAAFYLLALAIGFPLPYSMIVVSEVMWQPLLIATFAASWGRSAWENPRHRRQIVTATRVAGCLGALSAIYPLYVFVLLHTPESARLAVMLAVPVMKVVVRAGFSNALADLRDAAPVVVTVQSDVFNSLFLTYAMQSTAFSAIVGLMVLDVTYLAVCLRDMKRQVQSIAAVGLELDARKSLEPSLTAGSERRTPQPADSPESLPFGRLSMLEHMEQLISRQQTSTQDIMIHHSTQQVVPLESALTAVTPSHRTERAVDSKVVSFHEDENCTETEPPLPDSDAVLEQRYVCLIRRFLFSMEYVLLLNFVEACIPFIYASYMLLGFYSPNRRFYAPLAHIESGGELRDALSSIALYCSMQLVTLAAVCVAYYRWAGVSGLRQLAFVLELQLSDVQTNLVFWVFYNAQASLAHFGYDYSFRFAWLRSSPSST